METSNTTPQFIIAGASRSGTTSLYRYLSEHPNINVSEPKEVQFFNHDARYVQGLQYYDSYFSEHKSRTVIGESTPAYFYKGIRYDHSGKYIFDESEDSIIRIARDIPDVQIILTLRNPVNRIQSMYWKNFGQGRDVGATLEEALERELSGERKPEQSNYCFIYKNRYDIHLRHILEHIDKERVHIVLFEEWSKNSDPTLATLFKFLGVSNDFVGNSWGDMWNTGHRYRRYSIIPSPLDQIFSWSRRRLTRRIKSSKPRKPAYPPASKETFDLLNDIFRSSIEATEDVISRRLDSWKVVPEIL